MGARTRGAGGSTFARLGEDVGVTLAAAESRRPLTDRVIGEQLQVLVEISVVRQAGELVADLQRVGDAVDVVVRSHVMLLVRRLRTGILPGRRAS